MKNVVRIIGCASISILLALSSARAATMNDYCVTPPFIQESILPNLLLIIDNSASMYDVAYSDKGHKVCSGSGADCTVSGSCPSGQTCSFTNGRQPYYCYDQTYSSTKNYAGYFDSSRLYKYVGDFTAENPGEFIEETAAFSCTLAGTEVAKSINGQLCVVYTSANKVNKFLASGNYLNWLTASKFDVQKKILTGGKFNGTDLMAESRGCVGQSFIKEANAANFVNYNSLEPNTNIALGITFGLRGPYDAVNASAPSPGGQSYLEIFKGDYNQGKCQAAMTAIVSGGNADIKQTAADCLASTVGTTAVSKTKVVFQQSMQACWQRREGHAIAGDDINTVKNQCTDVYPVFATCSNDPKKVCTTATAATDCGAVNTCVYGPAAIVPGNAALLCGNEYEGQYYYYQGPGVTGTCTYNGVACITDANCVPASVKQCKKTSNYCTSDVDCLGSGNSCSKTIANTCSTSIVNAGWKLIPGITEAQMIATHNQFCSDMTATTVIDPTDAPSDTSLYDNVPAILSGVGVEAQLSQPIGTLTVKLKKTPEADGTIKPPTGVVSDFSSQVRIGAMTFNFAGSASEVSAGTLPAPKLCSNDTTKVCTLNIDCVSPGTCNATTAGTSNLDGGKIVHYVGTGHCLAVPATVCYHDADCTTAGDTCKSDGVGTYSSGLVKAVNDIKAQSWTPFAEAFYNAIGYFAKVPSTGLSRTDLRLNTGDFDVNRNPSQYRCQSNNILLISDGMSTADRNSSVDNLAKLYTAAGGATSWTTGAGACPSYAGSVNLDNMAWIGRNLNINTFSTSSASAAVSVANKEYNEYISSYVVFNGDSNGQAGECDSKTLLSQTATNGGTTLYQAVDPAALDTALRSAFKAIASGLTSGTAASILSNSQGSGASLLQAVYYPSKTFEDSTEVTWIGELQNLWFYIDPYLNNSTVREDTDSNKILNLSNDRVVNFFFDGKKTMVNRLRDTNGDGKTLTSEGTVSLDAVNSIWRAGKQLQAREASTRTIHTSVDGSSLLSDGFYGSSATVPGNASVLQPYLQTANNDSLVETYNVINYIRGTDGPYRNRKVSLINGTPEVNWKEWKLGDIVSSTPQLQSNINLNYYHLVYGDLSYKKYIYSSNYSKRGMVYVGANDGMLHAFKLGKFTTGTGVSKATLTGGTDLGEEQWAYIPRNALPYLKYLTDINYTHLYYTDGPIVISDVSIKNPSGCSSDYADCLKDKTTGTNWSTVLIGSMGQGGASAVLGDACVTGAAGLCVQSPIAGTGYSSYFAFDIANQFFNGTPSSTLNAQPTLKWEFSPPGLGYATSGATIVRVSGNNDGGTTRVEKNGKWFAVFASGPTGPINTIERKFLGKSNQNLKIFVIDLGSTVALAENTNYWVLDSEIANAFGGNILGAGIDADRGNVSSTGYYQDDVIYVGYTRANESTISASTKWDTGGVLRILTKEDPNPANWTVSKVIDGIGPVTGAIDTLQDKTNQKFWLYFGTGRFYSRGDDLSSPRYLVGVQDRCYTTNNVFDKSCVTTSAPGDTPVATGLGGSLTISNLSDQSTTINSVTKGWYLSLRAEDTANFNGAERVTSRPSAQNTGSVFFTTLQPTSDVCKLGGTSHIWAVNYKNGDVPLCNSLGGTTLLQMTSGAFEQVKFADLFTCKMTIDGSVRIPPPQPPPPVDLNEKHFTRGGSAALGFASGNTDARSSGGLEGGSGGDIKPPKTRPVPRKEILHIKEK